MLKHNLLIVFRTFKRSRGTFFINLIGLSTGLACALLIYLWVNDELKVDKFHELDQQLFQVMENRETSDGILTSPTTPGILAQALVEEMPEVKYASSTAEPPQIDNVTLSYNNRNILASGKYAGKDYFKMFTYPLKQGDVKNVLSDKNSIVISSALAEKLFDENENVVGKTLELQRNKEYTITGVFQIPKNSSDQFDFVLSYKTFLDKYSQLTNWQNTAPYTFLVLKKGTNPEEFNKKIHNFIKQKTGGEITYRTLFIRRYSDAYLYGKYENGVQAGGRIDYIKLFSFIALFILVIACINFMNLSTARASKRSKEISVKKVLGADRKKLITQYLGESLLISLLSLAAAVCLVEFFLPQFNIITGKDLALSFDKNILIFFLGVTLFTGFLAGSYPALYLSGLNPLAGLKGKTHRAANALFLRKGLVIFQFILTITFIVSVMVIYNQVEFIQTKGPGFNKDNILYLNAEETSQDKTDTFLSELKKLPGVINASSIGTDLTGHNSGTYGVEWTGKNPDDKTQFEYVAVNYDMLEMLGIKMTEGRTFSRDFSSDNSKIIFNEAAVKHMGLKDPIGKTINLWGEDLQIIGVAKDFHFESYYEQIKPLFFKLDPKDANMVMIKIKAGREKETIDKIKNLYKDFYPGFAFDYRFLDQDYQAQYTSEKRVSTLSEYFTGLAILISCLGLFGLVSLSAEQKTKEIGIRKVLGASVGSILLMLSKEFIKWIAIANLIAVPVAYYIMNKWLQDFAYHINIRWWLFVTAGAIALVIALLTISAQAIKAATANPVESLRYE